MKKMIILAFILCTDLINAQPLIIVKDGASYAGIIVSPSANKQIIRSANVLQAYIKRSTNVLLNISTSTQKRISIHIGTTPFVLKHRIPFDKLDQDAFILKKIDDENYAIVGGSDWGTEFGVYFFLEHYLQIYWLMPGSLGVDIPQNKSLIVNDEQIVITPAYLSRQLSPFEINGNKLVDVWGRYNGLHGRISFHHNLLNLFNPAKYEKSNPAFYPIVAGKKILPANGNYWWQPNFSAPGIIDTAVSVIIQYFKKNPDIESYSIGINDATNFDESQASLKRRSGKKNYLGLEDVSDDYFMWANQVAKKVNFLYPNKLLGTLAYNNLAEPPSMAVGVDPHIIPFITYERMRWADPKLKAHDQALSKSWRKITERTGWYDYAYGYVYLLPRVWFHTMQDYLRWGNDNKIKYYYSELYENWGEGPKAWVLAKLLWNPRQNVDSLLSKWYFHTAGANAAAKLRSFYSIWEKFWTKDIYSSKWNSSNGQFLPFNDVSYMDAVATDYITESDRLMDQAYHLADSPERKKRVEELRKMWKFYKLSFEICRNNRAVSTSSTDAIKRSERFKQELEKLSTDSLFEPTVANIKRIFFIK